MLSMRRSNSCLAFCSSSGLQPCQLLLKHCVMQALELMSGPSAHEAAVKAFALRSLHTCPPEQVSTW